MSLRLGSLFSGYGGLDLAVHQVFGDVETVWVSDIEPGPRKVLAHRFPGVPNLGDITTVDWSQVEPVDIIAGGSPCTDISSAGRMAGMYEGTRSNLWVCMRDAIEYLQPAVVVWENVRGASSARAASAMESDPRLLGDHVPVLRALGRVLGDLASLGYDASWHGLRAADVGAPHGRFRIFVVAADARGQAWLQRTRLCEGDTGRFGWGRPDHSTGETRPLVCPDCGHTAAAHRFYRECTGTAQQPDCICTRKPDQFALDLLPTPRATDGTKGGSSGDLMLPSAVMQLLPTPRSQNGEPRNQTIWERPAGEPQNLENALAHILAKGPADEEARPGEVLRDMRDQAGAEALRPPLGGSDPVPEPQDLLSSLREHAHGHPSGFLPRSSAQGDTDHHLRGVPGDRASACSPCGSGRDEQRPVKPSHAVPVLPSETALAGGPSRSHGVHFGRYEAAVQRWEAVLGREAPSPTKPGRNGRPKLNPAFAEFMMGAGPGWITNTPGVTDNEALRMAGNGVVRQQAEAALRLMLNRMETAS